MNLYIDIGNTNIKINFNVNEKEYFVNYETKFNYTVDTFYIQLPEQIKKNKIDNVFICSVVPEKENLVKGVIKKYFSIKPIMIAPPLKTGLQIKSNDPKSVGSDLIALGAFLNARDKDKSVMVNLGTATTIVVTKNGAFEGAIIAPGIQGSFNSLIANASKLNQLGLEVTTKIVGKTTQEAISIGLLTGHAEMIKALVRKIDPKVVYVSGGFAKKIISLLPDYQYVKEATIAGMKEIVKLNNEK